MADTQHVIRWENEDGRGCYSGPAYLPDPYTGGDVHAYHVYDAMDSSMDAATYRDIKHPAPASDPGLDDWVAGIIPDEDDYHCGFSSREQALSWFSSKQGRRALAKRGFVPYRFDVAPEWVIHGKKQVVFKRKEAEPRVRLDPVTLEEVK